MDDLKKGRYQPVYFLGGGESYYIDRISEFAESHILSDAEKGFNQTIVYGKDITGSQLLNVCKRYPMMGNYQVVMVKEAQHLKELDLFTHYLEAPLNTTILFLCWKSEKYDKRNKFFKALQKYIFFESVPLYDNQLPDWINGYCAEQGIKIAPRAAELLADHIGSELNIIANELTKISINKKPGETITEADVELQTGVSKEYNSFELQKHIARRDFSKCYKIIKYMTADGGGGSMPMITSVLYGFYSKLYLAMQEPVKSSNTLMSRLGVNYFAAEDFVSGCRNYNQDQVFRAMQILMEYDLKSKGVEDGGQTSAEDLLKEMLYKLLN